MAQLVGDCMPEGRMAHPVNIAGPNHNPLPRSEPDDGDFTAQDFWVAAPLPPELL
ncbi:MAG: hypothetical protein K0Q71_2125 [Thermomicrobiales bacterium]|jgi:hypothetical protein|nr:hypothetical protein [Thermomicrobiales bacterium]